MVDVLAIGAHPDDVEISAGGTLLKLRGMGYSAAICTATDGEPTPAGSREIRLAEAKKPRSTWAWPTTRSWTCRTGTWWIRS